ncbi:MAG: hypothetical protein QOI40_3446, partial [Alphaproteobacteria bacterium]|nr:hypothetical protein [Alphaproteobacteria bacterium]
RRCLWSKALVTRGPINMGPESYGQDKTR